MKKNIALLIGMLLVFMLSSCFPLTSGEKEHKLTGKIAYVKRQTL